MRTAVVELTAADIEWPFGGEPLLRCPTAVSVDPFPCYPHDAALVRKALRQVESAVSIELAPATLYVLHHEPLARTNGWAEDGYAYDEDSGKWLPAPGSIVLAGKRIPPHPAVTRYVVAHEYGHHVDYDLQRRRGCERSELHAEYARLRGLEHDYSAYGGGCWHSHVGELFANDFRILVADVETEFWPHPGFVRPERAKGLRAWWREALA